MDVSPKLNIFLPVIKKNKKLLFFNFSEASIFIKIAFTTFFHLPVHITAYSLYFPWQISFLKLTLLNKAFHLLQYHSIVAEK